MTNSPREPKGVASPAVAELPRGDARYPVRLLQIHDPPELLYHCGQLPCWDKVVAIVGTRRCTPYGRRIATRLAGDLARAGVLVLSGLAWGIDAAAHTGALEAEGNTAAVLAGSPDHCHPKSNLALYQQMLQRGQCVLSEYPPGTPLDKWRFRARNRLIAAIAHGVVVVEAPTTSGALITARFAADQTATEVFIIPGPADSPTFAGGHALVREGARLVTCADDILDDLGWQSLEDDAVQRPSGSRQVEPAGRLDRDRQAEAPGRSDASRVLAALDSSGAPADLIAERARLPYPAVLLALTTLELQGKVCSTPQGLYSRR